MNKILVTYASRTGSTAEVAAYVADVLRSTGAIVAVEYVTMVREVKGYDAVVIGSAIRMGHWLPEAVEFVKEHCQTLSHIPTAYFLVSGLLRNDTPEMRQRVLSFLDPVRAMLEPISIGLFAGKMDYSKIDGFDRSIAEAVCSADGDWRNWEEIREWAHHLHASLEGDTASIIC
jgi:menaquinone-dependent protoporphyrinogen oxidase